MKNSKDGFSLVEFLILLLVISVIGLATYGIWYRSNINKSKSSTTNSPTKTNQTASTNDLKTQEDLAAIGKGLVNYVNCETDVSCGHQEPQTANKLSAIAHGHLNYDISSYNYKDFYDSGGDESTFVYQICANFTKNTFNVSSFNNIWGENDNNGVDGTIPSSYSVHSSGTQCYINDLSYMGHGLFMVLTSEESQYKSQLYNQNYGYIASGVLMLTAIPLTINNRIESI